MSGRDKGKSGTFFKNDLERSGANVKIYCVFLVQLLLNFQDFSQRFYASSLFEKNKTFKISALKVL